MPPSDGSDDASEAALARAMVEIVVGELAAEGFDMTRPITFELVAFAPSEAIARVFAVRTIAMGLRTEVTPVDDPETPWRCGCLATLVPEVERLVALERLLDRLAHELGAVLDGLGVSGNAPGS